LRIDIRDLSYVNTKEADVASKARANNNEGYWLNNMRSYLTFIARVTKGPFNREEIGGKGIVCDKLSNE
jgi:hypothetical protein